MDKLVSKHCFSVNPDSAFSKGYPRREAERAQKTVEGFELMKRIQISESCR